MGVLETCKICDTRHYIGFWHACNPTPQDIHIFFSEEDMGFIATSELPSISAFGDTPEEALKELRVAYGLAKEALAGVTE